MRVAGLMVLLISTRTMLGCVSRQPATIALLQSPPGCLSLVGISGNQLDTGVRWHRSEDAAEQRTLNAWCGTVGPGVLAAARAAQAPVSGGIAVVSWNVHVGGGRLATLVRDLRSGHLTGGAPPAGFVLLLQEALRSSPAIPRTVPNDAPVPDRVDSTSAGGHREDVVSVAEAEGLSLFYLPSMRNGRHGDVRAEDRGNASLSTFDLTEPTGIELPFARQRRVAVAATLSGVVAGGHPWRLRIVSVHLDARTGPRQLWLFTSAHRERQVQSLIEALDDERAPTVVGADLNTWAGGRREPAFVAMKRWLPEFSASVRFARWLNLDFLFFQLPPTWNAESRPSAASFGSDHRPVVSVITPGT